MLRKRIGYERIRRVVCKGAQFEWYREPMARLKARRVIYFCECPGAILNAVKDLPLVVISTKRSAWRDPLL